MKWVEGTSYKTEEGRQAALTVTSELFTRPRHAKKAKKKRSMRRVDCSSGARSDVPRAMQAPKRSALQTGCVCPSKAIPESERGALCQIKANKVTITKCYTGCGIFYWEEQHWET